eukprot:Rhum_TRINITY_DN15405_c2_g1::Rhum_TRINITY_DN15405_c2_g1_i8::g.155140::m.155140
MAGSDGCLPRTGFGSLSLVARTPWPAHLRRCFRHCLLHDATSTSGGSFLKKGRIVDPSVYLRYNRAPSWRRLCKGIEHVRPALTACHKAVWLKQEPSTGPAEAFAATLRDMRWK